MRSIFGILLLLLSLTLSPVCAWAAEINVYLTHFPVTGASNKDELKTALQSLLMSRLNNEHIQTVDKVENADIVVTGSYISFGKVFSIDASARTKAGVTLVRAFEQGESQDDILPAVNKIANVIKDSISKNQKSASAGSAAPHTTTDKIQQVAGQSNIIPMEKAIIRPETSENFATIIKANSGSPSTSSNWISQKLDGEKIGLAVGKNLGEKGQQVFIADKRTLQYYLLGKEMQLIAESSLPVNLNIFSIDTADLDSDGNVEIYLTVFNGDAVASQVWKVDGTTLKMVNENLPFCFRAVTSQKSKTLYAQQLDQIGRFYGDLFTVIKNGETYKLDKPIKLPTGYNIYNSRVISLGNGKSGFIGINSDRYLLIFDENLSELWRSSDKFGGSESFFIRNDSKNIGLTGLTVSKSFSEQRIYQTQNGDILIPKNEGSFVLGDSRSYSKNSVYSLKWNSVSLEENWHTRQSQNYLSDYIYDDENSKLLLLEIVKKSGIISNGASALFIKKIE